MSYSSCCMRLLGCFFEQPAILPFVVVVFRYIWLLVLPFGIFPVSLATATAGASKLPSAFDKK